MPFQHVRHVLAAAPLKARLNALTVCVSHLWPAAWLLMPTMCTTQHAPLNKEQETQPGANKRLP